MRENLIENHFSLRNQPELIHIDIPIYTGDVVIMSSHMQAQVRHIQLIYNCIMRGYGCHLGRPAGTTTYRSLSFTIHGCLLLLLLHLRSAVFTAAAGGYRCAADTIALLVAS